MRQQEREPFIIFTLQKHIVKASVARLHSKISAAHFVRPLLGEKLSSTARDHLFCECFPSSVYICLNVSFLLLFILAVQPCFVILETPTESQR